MHKKELLPPLGATQVFVWFAWTLGLGQQQNEVVESMHWEKNQNPENLLEVQHRSYFSTFPRIVLFYPLNYSS